LATSILLHSRHYFFKIRKLANKKVFWESKGSNTNLYFIRIKICRQESLFIVAICTKRGKVFSTVQMNKIYTFINFFNSPNFPVFNDARITGSAGPCHRMVCPCDTFIFIRRERIHFSVFEFNLVVKRTKCVKCFFLFPCFRN